LLEGCPIVTLVEIPQRTLIVSGPFGSGLNADRVVAAIARGLESGGQPKPSLCALPPPSASAPDASPDEQREHVRALLDSLDFDVRMRASRAVIVGTAELRERTLVGSVSFEIATRARQGGIPAYAVTGENALSAFDARVLDLQLVLEARTIRALAAAGRALAKVI
jgi:hypothetical protein